MSLVPQATSIDILELTKYTANPVTTPDSDKRFISAVNATLVYWDGTQWAVLTGGGGGGGSTWETLYSNDNIFNITGGNGWTIADSSASANATLTLTKDAGSSGAALVFSQLGSGNDVTGTAGWSVSKAGSASFAALTSTGTAAAITTSGAAVWTILDNSSTGLRITPSGGPVMLTFDTSNGAEVVSTAATIFQVTQGKANFIQASNTVSALVVTDNTITTFGAAANSAGMVVFRSTSLTTGSLLQLQLTEGTLNGGFYLTARDVTGSANVFTVGEDGATVIAGAAGNTEFTITAGNSVISAGSSTITYDTSTSTTVFAVAGSGTYTGTTTSSFVTITPSGLTSGTAVYLPLAALADGKGLQVVANALTTGQAITVSSSAAAIATTGRIFLSTHSGSTGTSAVLNEFISNATDETVILKVTASAANAAGTSLAVSTATTTGNGITVTANSLTDGYGIEVVSSATAITSTGHLFFVSHTGTTSTSGVLSQFSSAATDETVIVGITASAANALGTSLAVTTATTTGNGITVTANALTDGYAIGIASSATAITSTGHLFFVNHTGTTGTSAVLSQFSSAATDETVVVGITASAANALGTALQITSATTTGNAQTITANSLSSGKALSVTSSSNSTDGATSFEPVLFSTTMTGAGGVGGRVRAYLTTNVALGAWSNAFKAEVVYGASGRTAGLGSAVNAEMTLSAGTTPGTYTLYEGELNLGTGALTGASTSLLTLNVNGADAATFSTTASCYILTMSGLTAGATNVFRTGLTGATVVGNMTAAIRIKIGATDYFIPLATATT